MQYLILLVSLALSVSSFANNVHIKFANQQIIGNQMYVDVEMKSDNGSFVLGSQNLRIFYNTAAIKLNKELSKSSLNAHLYSPIKFVESIEDINADQVNQLSFDANLGFSNLSIDLQDLRNGGTAITPEWTKIATLSFNIIDMEKNPEIVWARTSKTDQYATAFVEVSEWISINSTRAKKVEFFEDLSNIEESNTEISNHVEIGPNPTTDFVNIFNIDEDARLTVFDVSGKVRIESNLVKGSNRINLIDTKPGNYFFHISNKHKSTSHKVTVVN